MLQGLLALFMSFGAMAQTSARVEVLPNPQSLEDFEHQNKGCPENSECDQVMGMQLTRWKDLITKTKETAPEKRSQYLELFRAKYGIPVDFYTNKKSQMSFKPLFFNSSCKIHNPKQEDLKVLVGKAFLKGLTKEKAIVWRDQTQIEVPTQSLIVPQPVSVYEGNKRTDYALPLGDQPLFTRGKNLFVLKEEDDFFYMLKVNENGEWKIEDIDFTKLSEWEIKRENVACPEDKTYAAPAAFGEAFCKTIWDDENKKLLTVRMHQGCSN
jgi:hypothetical protein